MNIIIIGAGEVGKHLAQNLSTQQHNITLIDRQNTAIQAIQEKIDAATATGNGASATILAEHNVAECDLLLALTNDHNTNLIAASIAKALGAKTTIARIHPTTERDEWLFSYKQHLKIDYLFSTEQLAASQLNKYIRNPNTDTQEIARGRIELRQTTLPQNSPLTHQPIQQLQLPNNIRIAAIQRQNQHLIPTGKDQLQPGDTATICGLPNAITQIIPLLNPDNQPKTEPNIMIFGGGEYALVLVNLLQNTTAKIRIMEQQPNECARLSHLLQNKAKNTTILQADATSLEALKEEQAGDLDFFIAVSPDDEDNVMTCLQAKDLGAQHCLTLIHRPDRADIIQRLKHRLGILAVVSPRLTVNRDLLRFIQTKKAHHILPLKHNIEVIQLVLKNNTTLANKKIKDIPWPQHGALIGILRNHQTAIIPNGETKLLPNDAIYLITTPQNQKPFIKLLTR